MITLIVFFVNISFHPIDRNVSINPNTTNKLAQNVKLQPIILDAFLLMNSIQHLLNLKNNASFITRIKIIQYINIKISQITIITFIVSHINFNISDSIMSKYLTLFELQNILV